jgi:hypothetical protein
MNVKTLVLAASVLAATALTVPAFAAACPKEGSTTLSCGSYAPGGSYSANEKSALNSGGNQTFLAVGMLETSTMDSNYTYGDGKSGDAANFGYMKDNWYSYRTWVPSFKGQSSSQYNNGAKANGNYSNANSYANSIISAAGWTTYWEVHRGGQGRVGVWNSDTDEYYQGVNWIQQQNGTNTGGERYWVSVPAI